VLPTGEANEVGHRCHATVLMPDCSFIVLISLATGSRFKLARIPRSVLAGNLEQRRFARM